MPSYNCKVQHLETTKRGCHDEIIEFLFVFFSFCCFLNEGEENGITHITQPYLSNSKLMQR